MTDVHHLSVVTSQSTAVFLSLYFHISPMNLCLLIRSYFLNAPFLSLRVCRGLPHPWMPGSNTSPSWVSFLNENPFLPNAKSRFREGHTDSAAGPTLNLLTSPESRHCHIYSIKESTRVPGSHLASVPAALGDCGKWKDQTNPFP